MQRLAFALLVCLAPACSKPSTPTQTAPATPQALPVKAQADAKPKAPEYPYPECAAIVAWLKENVNDPKALEIVKWVSRDGPDKANKWSKPGDVYIVVKIRSRNAVGAVVVSCQRFNFSENKLAASFEVECSN